MNSGKTTLGQRIQLAIDAAGSNQSALARALKLSSSGIVNGWVKQGTPPGGEHLEQLPHILKVNGHWLLTGEGVMRLDKPNAEIEAYYRMEAVVLERLRPSAEEPGSLKHIRSEGLLPGGTGRDLEGPNKLDEGGENGSGESEVGLG